MLHRVRYEVAKTTILGIPNTMLSAMLSPHWPQDCVRDFRQKDEHDNSIFIDADGKAFKYVLMYCRLRDMDQMKKLLPRNVPMLERIRILCDFLSFPDFTKTRRIELDPFQQLEHKVEQWLCTLDDTMKNGCFVVHGKLIAGGVYHFTLHLGFHTDPLRTSDRDACRRGDDACDRCSTKMQFRFAVEIGGWSRTLVDVGSNNHAFRSRLKEAVYVHVRHCLQYSAHEKNLAFLAIVRELLHDHRAEINRWLDRRLIIPPIWLLDSTIMS